MITDYIYQFRATNGVPSKCRIRLYEAQATFNKGDIFVICSQLLDDEEAGQSVTNAAETIATGVMYTHHLQPMRMIWIEHYPPRGTRGEIKESLDRVTFEIGRSSYRQINGQTILAEPQWNRTDRSYVEAMIGETF